MKKVLYSAFAVALAIGGIAATKGASKSTAMRASAFWVLIPGANHLGATVTSNYTFFSSTQQPPCNSNVTLCAIKADQDPTSGRPIISGTLQANLTLVKAGGKPTTDIFYKPQ